MTPKEKALELANKFVLKSVFDMNNDELIESRQLAKQYALIAVDEIIKVLYSLKFGNALSDEIEYYEQVRQEIINL
jgi:hypothetical protein